MKIKKLFTILMILSIFGASAEAFSAEKTPRKGTIRIWGKKTKTFVNTNCEKTKTCDLKRVFFQAEHYEMWREEGPHYGTELIAGYETNKVASLENYVFVQYMRGCVFDFVKNADSKIKTIMRTVKHLGKDYPFCFQNWVFDSEDNDPASFGGENTGRLSYYVWNKINNSYEEKTAVYYGTKKPSMPKLYIKDYPQPVYIHYESIANASLEFRTCLYRNNDVPQIIIDDKTDLAMPIICFNWQHNFVYNFNTGKIEEKNEIVVFCFEKPPQD